MKLQALLQQLYYEPALILPEAHASIRRLIESRIEHSEPFAREPGQDACGNEVETEQMEIRDGIAFIPIGGAIGQGLDPFERGSGAVDVDDIAADLDQAEEAKDVRAMVLDFDSPGGMVLGTPELADRISQVDKPIFSFTRSLIASAAYWLASSTDGIFSTETANIGSIGVYIPVHDMSMRYAQAGIKVELIKAGKLKGMGYPGTAMSDAGREHLQERVNKIYGMFTDHVKRNRGDISADTMQGQVFMGAEAMERGLIDGIVKSIDDVAGML